MYKCDNCGHTDKKFFGVCPSCREGMGIFVEVASSSESTGMFKPRDTEVFTGTLDIKKVDKDAPQMKSKIKTQFKALNEVVSSVGGFVDGHVVILAANPGTGKSTLLSQISSPKESNYKTLYISSEESYSQINNRMLRVNPESTAELLSTTSIDEVLAAVKDTDTDLVIVDSINSIEFGVGYATTARYANDLTKLAKDLNKVLIIISQVSKGGEITGMQSLIHVVDTVIYMEKSDISETIILSSSKNRFGEINQVAAFEHTQDGLVEVPIGMEDVEKEIGITYCSSRFGHKNMTISIESLVTEAQSGYGIKKSVGYDLNSVTLLCGILAYNAGINFSSKDVYIAIGNGLRTDDVSLGLAVCNSILSSCFKLSVIEKASGSVSLNGRLGRGAYIVKDGDKIEINHIKDLIGYYTKVKR